MAALKIPISTHELLKKDEYLNLEESTDYRGLAKTTWQQELYQETFQLINFMNSVIFKHHITHLIKSFKILAKSSTFMLTGYT